MVDLAKKHMAQLHNVKRGLKNRVRRHARRRYRTLHLRPILIYKSHALLHDIKMWLHMKVLKHSPVCKACLQKLHFIQVVLPCQSTSTMAPSTARRLLTLAMFGESWPLSQEVGHPFLCQLCYALKC